MTLYLKYRPQKLEELDSETVRESLKRIVVSGKPPHAFLFAGPKGTGKTSAARIIAKILNCERLASSKKTDSSIEPCGKCDQCLSISQDSNLDVIEMDAASHRGIDDVRALRDAVKLAPAKARNKVYIIDEVHMLTTEAANALLKTLEEPPSHVYFILATTNPEKLIETIRSRVTLISFKKATRDEIVRSLRRVVKGEKIKIEEDTLGLIAKAAAGSFRDAVKTLEQLLSEKRNLSPEVVGEFLFQRKAFEADSFLALLAKKETKKALQELDAAVTSGVLVSNILMAMLERLRGGLLALSGIGEEKIEGFERKEIISLIKLFGKAGKDIASSPIEELPLEVAIVEWCEGTIGRLQSVRLNLNSPLAPGETNSVHSRSRAHDTLDSREQDLARTKSSASRRQTDASSRNLKEVSEEVWRKILATVKPINTSIEALLRAARPVSYDGNTLTLGVFYKFHKERLEDFHHRRILEEVVGRIMGSTIKVICILTSPPAKIETTSKEIPKEEVVLTEGGDEDIIRVAKEIFGN